jgi:porin
MYKFFQWLTALTFVSSAAGSEFLSGDWDGARQNARDAGVDFSATYSTDLSGNPIGGRSQGFTNAGELNTNLILDLEKLAKIPGCSLFNSLCWCSGSNLSAQYIDNQFIVQQLYGGETWKLVELYLQESLFDDYFNVKIGRLCTGNDFVYSPLYLRYVTGAINSNPISLIFNASFSTYPFATWGAYLHVKIWHVLAKWGVYNNNPSIWENRYHGVNFTFESDRGVFFISEWTYLHNQDASSRNLPGNYTIGGYYINGSIEKFNGHSTPDNYGYYFLFDQMLYQKDPLKTNEGLNCWGAFLFAPSDQNPFPLFIAGGIVYQGIAASRPKDALCFGLAYGHYSYDLRKAELRAMNRKIVNPYGSQTQTAEMDLELNYWVQATPWLVLTPVVQYIINPKGYGTIPNAFVTGMQIIIDL